MVPIIRHDFTADQWESVARILLKGIRMWGYYPLRISKAFVAASLFGEFICSKEMLLHSFFMYVSSDDRDLLQGRILKEKLDIGEDEDLADILQTFSSRRNVTTG